MPDAKQPIASLNGRRAVGILARAVVLVATLWALISWVEAEKEARVLCALSKPGTSATEIDRLFGTANLLNVQQESSGARRTLHVTSFWNLALSGCEITIDNGAVRDWSYEERFRLSSITGLLLLLGLGVLTAQETLAALGSPRAVPTSSATTPPLARRRRVASAIFAVALAAGVLSAALLMRLITLPSLEPIAEGVVGVITLTHLLQFIIGPIRSRAPDVSARASLLGFIVACSGVMLLLGG